LPTAAEISDAESETPTSGAVVALLEGDFQAQACEE